MALNRLRLRQIFAFCLCSLPLSSWIGFVFGFGFLTAFRLPPFPQFLYIANSWISSFPHKPSSPFVRSHSEFALIRFVFGFDFSFSYSSTCLRVGLGCCFQIRVYSRSFAAKRLSSAASAKSAANLVPASPPCVKGLLGLLTANY